MNSTTEMDCLEQKDTQSIDAILNSPWFQPGMFKSLDYIRGFVGSQVIFQMLKNGVFDDLLGGMSLMDIAIKRDMDAYLLKTVFEYLTVEEVLIKEQQNGLVSFRLSEYGQHIKFYEGWFNILVGGYGSIFSNIDTMLRQGIGAARRDGGLVGMGSCQISRYDTIPITKAFIQSVKPGAKRIVDFGCGNALYLCSLAKELDGIKAIGIEPDGKAYRAGLEQVAQMGLQDQVSLVNVDALDYEIEEHPDFILFGFVLQEIIAQIGRDEMIHYLKKLGQKFTDSYLMVMEVDYDIDNHQVMKTPVGSGYYNPYFLLHPFTQQLLLPKCEWDDIFAAAGYAIIRDEVTSPKADPTGLGICYVLQYRHANAC